ncbi:hypothetical protein L6164_024747 [Bauhinia variegata]|uniref:Uncharacterized protein n=1 Tax=Bauhinia variegata TaxID=167791 RepID=A0ACB9M012_BAUVA|nr:hypothetical protein L6164_024747 [Bauhinia variegata]
MELRSCSNLHYIQTIKEGVVMKVLNITRGRPTLSFKNVKDICDSFKIDNDKVKVETPCLRTLEERPVKVELEASACNASDGHDKRSCDLDGNSFDNITLKQIKEGCRTRKRKHSQGLDSSKRKIKIEAYSSQEDCSENQMAEDDSDFMETLSNWRFKQSKNMKGKTRCLKDPVSTFNQEIIPVFTSDETTNSNEFLTSSGDSAALVEVKFQVTETDCLDQLKKLSKLSDSSSAWDGLEESSALVVKEEPEMGNEYILENESYYGWEQHADFIPLQMVWDPSRDIVVCDSDSTSNQSLYLPAIEYESDESIIHPDLDFSSPREISSAEDHNVNICPIQPDGDTALKLPYVTAHKGLHRMDLGSLDDGPFFGDCSQDKFTSDAEVPAKTSSISKHNYNPDGCLICTSDDFTETEEEQSLAPVCIEEKGHVSEATDKMTSSDGYESRSRQHRPERLLSTRKAISPSSQERLCKAMQSVDLHDKDLKCRGKLSFGKHTDENGTAEGANEISRAICTNNPNKIGMKPKTFKRGSPPKGILKTPHPSRLAPRLSTGCASVQSCSESAIAFSKQQMHGFECLAMKLTKELKSMRDIMNDMLRSEFCLNTSLRYKVNEATMAVKNATRAEETTRRCLSTMARNCSRFCKLMRLTDDSPPASQDEVRKERKKIAFADETGGRLCDVRLYEDDRVS